MMTVGELRGDLPDFKDHLPVVVILPDGTYAEIEAVTTTTVVESTSLVDVVGIELT